MKPSRTREAYIFAATVMALTLPLACAEEPFKIEPAALPRIGHVDQRFQSFNVEMVEVTGGRFWAPYRSAPAKPDNVPSAKLSVPGIDPSLFRIRAPIDLTNARLRKLAAALGPSYMRVSGTWANSTYFYDSDTPEPESPPPGFGGVLTRRQWRGVVDFARAVDAHLVTSFAISKGVRDDHGIWTPVEARKVLDYTQSIGGKIWAAEFFNEPTMAVVGGAPPGYDAAAYGRDFAVFLPFVRKAAPGLLVLGPGSVGEGGNFGHLDVIKSADMLAASPPGLDAFSYHFYGTVSKRCAALAPERQTTSDAALSEEWLSRTVHEEEFYAALRDRFTPGKPLWLTETGETACGGNPWAASFIDSFRYLDQLGQLAKRGVQVVIHNTLAASDYGLIDEATLTPRPNYWAAVLWRRMMGTTVLDAGIPPASSVRLYAHCLAGHAGGVALLAINTDRSASHELALPVNAERYTLTSSRGLLETSVELNGKTLELGPQDNLPEMKGQLVRGRVTLAPASITFLAVPDARNANCQP